MGQVIFWGAILIVILVTAYLFTRPQPPATKTETKKPNPGDNKL